MVTRSVRSACWGITNNRKTNTQKYSCYWPMRSQDAPSCRMQMQTVRFFVQACARSLYFVPGSQRHILLEGQRFGISCLRRRNQYPSTGENR